MNYIPNLSFLDELQTDAMQTLHTDPPFALKLTLPELKI